MYNEVVKIDILKEAEEIIDNYIKKQSEFSFKFNKLHKLIKKKNVLIYAAAAFICILTCAAYLLLK